MKRREMHFYQFHIGDYKSHTHHLSPIEDLAYRRLLDHYYLHEVPIKQRDIARQLGLRDNEQEVLSVLNEFFVSTEAGFINPRADEEIAKYRKLSESGKKGAATRWNNGPPIATPLPPQCDGNGLPNATPIATNTQYPITNNQVKQKATVVAPPDGVSVGVWEDFVKHRKAKRAQITDRVIDDIRLQAKLAGWSMDDALNECIVRNWQSFKAAWVQQKTQSFGQQSIAEQNRRRLL